jgi:hypothetical protein
MKNKLMKKQFGIMSILKIAKLIYSAFTSKLIFINFYKILFFPFSFLKKML